MRAESCNALLDSELHRGQDDQDGCLIQTGLLPSPPAHVFGPPSREVRNQSSIILSFVIFSLESERGILHFLGQTP